MAFPSPEVSSNGIRSSNGIPSSEVLADRMKKLMKRQICDLISELEILGEQTIVLMANIYSNSFTRYSSSTGEKFLNTEYEGEELDNRFRIYCLGLHGNHSYDENLKNNTETEHYSPSHKSCKNTSKEESLLRKYDDVNFERVTEPDRCASSTVDEVTTISDEPAYRNTIIPQSEIVSCEQYLSKQKSTKISNAVENGSDQFSYRHLNEHLSEHSKTPHGLPVEGDSNYVCLKDKEETGNMRTHNSVRHEPRTTSTSPSGHSQTLPQFDLLVKRPRKNNDHRAFKTTELVEESRRLTANQREKDEEEFVNATSDSLAWTEGDIFAAIQRSRSKILRQEFTDTSYVEEENTGCQLDPVNVDGHQGTNHRELGSTETIQQAVIEDTTDISQHEHGVTTDIVSHDQRDIHTVLKTEPEDYSDPSVKDLSMNIEGWDVTPGDRNSIWTDSDSKMFFSHFNQNPQIDFNKTARTEQTQAACVNDDHSKQDWQTGTAYDQIVSKDGVGVLSVNLSNERRQHDNKNSLKSLKATEFHHGSTVQGRGTRLKCEICNKIFRSTKLYNRHLQIHEGSRPFVCVMCNNSFKDKETLKRHIRTHSGEQPYSCNVCYRKFSHSGSLSNHKKLHKIKEVMQGKEIE